jgi:hypothetical protein
MNPLQWIRETFLIVRPSAPPPHVCAAIAAQESLAAEADRTAQSSREYAERLDQFARFIRSVQGRTKIDPKATRKEKR